MVFKFQIHFFFNLAQTGLEVDPTIASAVSHSQFALVKKVKKQTHIEKKKTNMKFKHICGIEMSSQKEECCEKD